MPLVDRLILGAELIALSSALTWLMLRVRILAVPNDRSSHERPVPSSGGLSIVVAVYVGMLILYRTQDGLQIGNEKALGLGAAALTIAVVGLLDDLGILKSFKSKLAGQIVACGFLLYSDIRVENFYVPFFGPMSLEWWSYPITLIWVIGLTNIFNFMDGLDGLAAGTALLVAAGLSIISLNFGGGGFVAIGLVLFSAIAGFFVFNFPHAKIFMGDVGSQFLGFVFASLALLASQNDDGGTFVYVVPLLFFHFIFDAVFTFFRRLFAGENVTQAHKGHLYQLLNQVGYSHPRVSMIHFGMVLWQAAGVIAIVGGAVAEPGWVLVFYILLQLTYAVAVLRAAKQRGIVDGT